MTESDLQMIEEVESSLLGLGNPNKSEATSVDEANDKLLQLKRHIQQIREQRLNLSSQASKDNETLDSTNSHQHRVEQDIIKAKMQVSELLSLKDSIARDVARAKRELGQLETPLKEIPQPGTTMSAMSMDMGISIDEDEKDNVTHDFGAATSFDDILKKDVINEDDLQKLQSVISEEMEKLHSSEQRLVKVVDEISSIQKRKAKLKKMHDDAQDIW